MMVCWLAGCSALRIGYSNGESVAYWWLNSYVEFEQDQRPWAKQHIADFFTWHRQTQLPEYAQLLLKEQKRLQHTVTPADVLADYNAFKNRFMLSIEHTLPQFAQLALALQPHQIDHLEKKFAANNDGYRKENLRGDFEERQLSRFKKVMKQAEYWFGDFSKEQEKQIRAASDARPLNNELWMAIRLRRQQDLIAMLKKIQQEKPSQADTVAMLKHYLDTNYEQYGTPEQKPFLAASNESTAKMVALIANIATPSQKEHAYKKMQHWIEDCRSLAAPKH